MKQTFDFDNIQEGDIAILHGIRGVYSKTDNKSSCYGCAFRNVTCYETLCDENHIWKDESEVNHDDV